jgi:hypothetical protein
MTSALRILEKITTDFTIFEKNQVLTESQLNSVTDYLNDQARLMRIHLLGVGVVSGFQVSIAGDLIKVTKGVGITTDGDLLYYNQDKVFDRYLEYGQDYPKYAPFYVGETSAERMIPVYELITQDAKDSRSGIFPLSEFTTQTTKELKNIVAVLLMESYVKDRDICTATDCDNLGRDCVNTPKLLLIDKADLNSLLNHAIATPDQAFKALDEIVADRPLIPSSINSASELAEIYLKVCKAISKKLTDALPNLYLHCAPFLTDVFSSDPTDGWKTRLTEIQRIATSDVGIQYYYDFLKDVVETYNQFWQLLFGDNTWCCPDINWFPKHLLLGNLVSDSNLDENRTAFYPSPVVSQTSDNLNHAKFLARKLDTLIQSFQLPIPSTDAPIRITPSLFEDQPLEERAIPYYYPVNNTNPINESWNYYLHQRRMDNRNYSYHALDYRAQGAAANPLAAQIGRFSFFRIEGHLGKNVTTVVAEIESEIKSKNLPFTVCSILLGQDKTKVVKKPGIRYTDLHRFHYLLRQDTYHQLNEVASFSDRFNQNVAAKVAQSVTDVKQAEAFKTLASQHNITVAQNAESAAAQLKGNYTTYKAGLSWQTDLNTTVTEASRFKLNIGDIVKTEFTTPFDTLIGSTHFQWLDWLDQIIKRKDDSEDDKLLFTNFISRNPGMEHFAGVIRGGTFILVHDENNTVIADFMLPYYLEDKVEVLPEEPTLTKPGIRSDEIIDGGIRVIPSVDKRLIDFKGILEPELTKKFDLQQKYFDIYKGFVDSTKDTFIGFGKGTLQTTPPKITDPILGLKTQELVKRREILDILKQKAIWPELPDRDRTAVANQIQQAETDLAESLKSTTEHIAISGLDVSPGSEGFQAMTEVSSSIANLSLGGEALNNLQTGLTATLAKTNNIGLTTIISNISNTIRR